MYKNFLYIFFFVIISCSDKNVNKFNLHYPQENLKYLQTKNELKTTNDYESAIPDRKNVQKIELKKDELLQNEALAKKEDSESVIDESKLLVFFNKNKNENTTQKVFSVEYDNDLKSNNEIRDKIKSFVIFLGKFLTKEQADVAAKEAGDAINLNFDIVKNQSKYFVSSDPLDKKKAYILANKLVDLNFLNTEVKFNN